MIRETKRDIAERVLLDKFPEIRPFTTRESDLVERYKDRTFGVSNLAFALYSNGHNLRGRSTKYPYGLVFFDSETLFSVGYYRKEHDSEDTEGYIFFVAPRGRNAIQKVGDLSHRVFNEAEIPCKGVYTRFLTLNQYVDLLNQGFLPAKEHPWHDDSPEEDETLTSSYLKIDDIIASNGEVKPLDYGSRNTRRKSKMTHNRFRNFLERNGLEYSLKPYTAQDFETAKGIVKVHFKVLGENGEPIGSTAEDHFNSIDPNLTTLKGVKAYLGYLSGVPVSYFAGEEVSDSRFALYTPFTLRSPEFVLPQVGFENGETDKGFSAMPIFSYIELMKELRKEGITEVLFGGSEHRDLNRIKRQLGCRNDPSYWVVKVK